MIWLYIGGAIVAAVLVLMAAASNKLKVRTHTVRSEKIGAPFSAVHITDLHESLFGDGQSKLLSAVENVKPDVIFVTGDMIEDDDADPSEKQVLTLSNPARHALEALPKIAPTYMVLGNHESNIPHTDLLTKEIEAFGVDVLHRRDRDDPDMRKYVSICGNDVCICGADDPYFDRREPQKKHRSMAERINEDKTPVTYDKSVWRARLEAEYADINNEHLLTLLLSHRPEEYKLYEKLGFDAAFSGHAHGGQWRLPPFINGLYAPHQGFFPSHAGGVYQCGAMTHIVSRGLSKKRFVRIFNRPELWAVRFEPKA